MFVGSFRAHDTDEGITFGRAVGKTVVNKRCARVAEDDT